MTNKDLNKLSREGYNLYLYLTETKGVDPSRLTIKQLESDKHDFQ